MSIRCGNRVHSKLDHEAHHHATVAQVRLCYSRPAGLQSDEEEYDESQAEANAIAEIEAERRNERFFEERGADDGFEQWEASRGLIDYVR